MADRRARPSRAARADTGGSLGGLFDAQREFELLGGGVGSREGSTHAAKRGTGPASPSSGTRHYWTPIATSAFGEHGRSAGIGRSRNVAISPGRTSTTPFATCDPRDSSSCTRSTVTGPSTRAVVASDLGLNTRMISVSESSAPFRHENTTSPSTPSGGSNCTPEGTTKNGQR